MKQSELITAALKGDATLVVKNARVVNVFTNEILEGAVALSEDTIIGVGKGFAAREEIDAGGAYLCPGFIDAHVHIESSMVIPDSFSRVIMPHGTTTIIADPHEIANVCGVAGVRAIYKLSDALPLRVLFMMPSCAPATPFENSGATLTAEDMEQFMRKSRILGLGEVMDAVSTINCSKDMMDKLRLFDGRPIDGHAPLLSGRALNAYRVAGPSTDHECSNFDEVLEKLRIGMRILLRVGSAANGMEELITEIVKHGLPTDNMMFCTDDKHPNDLLEKGHIDYIIKKAIAAGVDPIIAVKCASHHAARYFLLNNRGAIAPGFLADFVIIDNFRDFNILEVYKKGKLMFDGKEVAPFEAPEIDPHLIKRSHETFHVAHLTADDFTETRPRAVLGMVPGEIVTTDAGYADKIDLENDILKIAVIERHKNTHHIGIGYIKGYGLKSGAVATSISHDSHNIIVVGTNEEDIAAAANRVVELGGGIVVLDHGEVLGEVRLQIAGIMSEAPLVDVNRELENAKEKAFALGVSRGVDPFMTLSFMALPVIPTLRLTTRCVFVTVTLKYV